MKKFFKNPFLLFGSVATVAGLSFFSSPETDLKAQGEAKWCDYDTSCGPDDDECCDLVLANFPCHCDDQC